MKSEVIWLGFSVPPDRANFIFRLDPQPAVSTQKFGWSFARVLQKSFDKVYIISVCQVQNFPIVRKVFFNRLKFKYGCMDGVLLGFVNIVLLKHVTRFFSCLFAVLPLIFFRRPKWIFVHGLHTPFLLVALLVRISGVRVAVVITDPPGVVVFGDSKIVKRLKELDAALIVFLLKYIDVVIALAPSLVHRLAPNKPSLIFPGIVDSNSDLMPAGKNFGIDGKLFVQEDPFTVMYAGGLNKRYGVDLLLDAMVGFGPEVRIKLKLFGRGELEDRIRAMAVTGPRIEFGGFIDPLQLPIFLKKADLLVNPRPTNESFASMSFPSKLIEYLVTGRPVLTTRIPSIPDSLQSHFYFIDYESAEGIRQAISQLMALHDSDRAKFGLAAQKFVLENFSEDSIAVKIRALVGESGPVV